MKRKRALSGFKSAAGFTTAELLIVMVLSSLLAGIVFLNYLFINKTMANWRKSTEMEQALALYGARLDHSIRHLVSIDSVDGHCLVFHNRFNRREVICFSDKPESLNVAVDSVQVKYLSTDMTLDRNLDGVVEINDLDENINGHLDSSELAGIDLIEYQMRFTWGNNKSFQLKSYNRLINRKPVL